MPLFVVGVVLFSCKQEQRNQASHAGNDTLRLELMWETTGFKTPESVLYDSSRQVLFVSNINDAPGDKDGNGYISKVSLDGQTMVASWAQGLSAPKGMGLSGDTLYVTDVNELVLIDVRDGTVLSKIPLEGTPFLNDIAVSGRTVYITDSRNQRLMRYLPGGQLTLWLEADTLAGINGIFAEGNYLFVGTPRGVMRIDTATKMLERVALSTAGIDGLSPWGGGYLVSDWAGETRFLKADMAPFTLLNTTADTIQSADFSFIPREEMLIIPTFFDNRVRAYALKGKPVAQH